VSPQLHAVETFAAEREVALRSDAEAQVQVGAWFRIATFAPALRDAGGSDFPILELKSGTGAVAPRGNALKWPIAVVTSLPTPA